MITISDCICTRVNFYAIIICTDGMTTKMCPCMLLATICYVDIMHLRIYLCHCLCLVISLHPHYNIVRCIFCSMMSHLSDDFVSLIVCDHH